MLLKLSLHMLCCVGTRLNKLDDGEYDAIILAAAGVMRLGLEDRISEVISTEIILPAIGQGAIGILMQIFFKYVVSTIFQ